MKRLLDQWKPAPVPHNVAEIYEPLRQGTIALLPKHHVRFAAFRPEYHARFKAIVLATWRRMPLWARRRILKYWRENWYMPWPSVIFSPLITVEEIIRPRNVDTEEEAGTVWGTTGANGHKLQFCGPILMRMPDAIAQDLIAHELAHVLQYASGGADEVDDDGTTYLVYPGGDALLPGEQEEDADDIMESWGFDATAMDDWSLEVCPRKVPIVTFKEFLERHERFLRTGIR